MGQCGRRPGGDVITGEAKLRWRAEHETLQTAPCRSDASDMGEGGGEGLDKVRALVPPGPQGPDSWKEEEKEVGKGRESGG